MEEVFSDSLTVLLVDVHAYIITIRTGLRLAILTRC